MYRTSSHEPRYNRSTRKGRHDESREASENSTSEDEEESTESGTEESETPESQLTGSFRRASLYSADSSYHPRKPFNRNIITDSFVTSHVCHSKVSKHDKVTQKNFLSPFPSFTMPPIYRELPPSAYRRHSGKSIKEKHVGTVSIGRPPKHSPRSQESDDEKEDSVCYIHKSCQRKGYDKHRGQKDHGSHQSRCHRPERILTCVNAGTAIEPSGTGFPNTSSSKSPTPARPATAPPQRPKTADGSAETVTSGRCQESRARSGRKTTGISSPFIVDQTQPGEAAPAKGKKNRKLGGDESGEVKEKLVYVVEEKGKDVSKVETDLFTLNEILTIKKDLLELSEFAKKLKKLKEMKRDAETGANQLNSCQCQPAAELLKDVNRRIEALEARQEELERGSKSEKRGYTEKNEKDLKKMTNGKKSSLESQSVAVNTSAMTTIPYSPKTEMFVSRTDNSNNSDIVNELMDIKTQLLKLEQRRMSKAVLETAAPTEDLKMPKKEEHAIAVFSSKTYILTENFDKRKGEVKVVDEEKLNNYCSTAEEDNSRKEQRKEQVANWLKNVSPKNQENAYQRDENVQRGGEWKNDLKCKNCLQVVKVEDMQNQEPQKNRATEKDGRAESDLGFTDTKKNDPLGKDTSQLTKYKECIVTPSGKIFACLNCSSGRISTDTAPVEGKPKPAPPPSSLQRRTQDKDVEAPCSIPSAVLVKECLRKFKPDLPKKLHCGGLFPRVIISKSMQELSVSSSKTEKTVRNTNLKNIDKMAQQREKKHKDGKNQCLKLLEAHLMALRKTLRRDSTTTSSCTRSEFLASINLDTGTTSEASGLQGSGDNNMVMTYPAVAELDNIYLDDCEQDDRKSIRAEEKRRKRREAECRKLLKRKLKMQKRCESAERKRKAEERKCELKQLKQRCKELKYVNVIEETLPEKKSKSLETQTPVKRSVDVCSPKKSRSSQDVVVKKVQGTEEGIKKILCSEEPVCKKKLRTVEEHLKKCCCVPASSSKYCRCEEEHVPKTHRYWEEVCDERHREDPSRRCCEREDPPRRYREKEDVVRGYYEREDVPRRYCEREDVLRRQYDREILRRLCETESAPRKHRYENEDDFPQRSKEGSSRRLDRYYIPKKFICEPIAGKLYREDHQKGLEDPSETSRCVKSEDSWQVFKDRQEEQLRKMKYKMNKQQSETCKLKNVMKNIGLLKLNFPIAEEFCDGKHDKCKKPKTPEKQEKPKREKECAASDDDQIQWTLSQVEYDDDDDDDDEYYDDCKRTYPSHHSRVDLTCHPYTDQHKVQQMHSHHQSHHQQPSFQGNCGCLRVFLQSQEQKGWSGLGPFRKISSDSTTESSRTGESSKSLRSNFRLPKPKPSVFQVTYSGQDRCADKCPVKFPEKCPDKCQEKEDKCNSKCRKQKEKCEKKKEKRKQKKHKCKCKKDDEDCCKCKKCGNVHRKGCRPQPRPCQEECCKKVPMPRILKEPIHRIPKEPIHRIPKEPIPCIPKEPIPCIPKEPINQQEPIKCYESVPFLSFLTQFCKSRPRDPRDPKAANFFKKLDEIRYLKMCATTGRKPSKGQGCNRCSDAQGKCNCKSKLTEIESRLCLLEHTKDECSDKSQKKKHKKKKNKKCKCSDCETEGSEGHRKESEGCERKECSGCEKGCGEGPKNNCNQCEKERKTKKKCCYVECHSQSDSEKGKKKKRKKRKNCDKCQRREFPCGPKPCETPTYYQTIYYPTPDDSKNNSSFSGTPKSSTAEEKESTESTNSKEEPPQKGLRMKEGLSSLHSVWKNLRRYSINHSRNGVESLMKKIRGKKSSCTLGPDILVVDDLKQGSPIALVESGSCWRRRNKSEMKKRKRERKSSEKMPSMCHRKRH